MKRNRISKYLALMALIMMILPGCDKPITEFGYEGILTGTVRDASGNIVAGDITSSSFVIRVRAEGDISTIDLRVNGDGTFKNSKLYPSVSKVWVSGPVVAASSDTVTLDLSGGKTIEHDFVVTPVFTVGTPAIVGAPTSTSVNISYSITANSAKTPNKRELYCSTNPYPNTSTGSGAFYSTVKVTLSNNSGTASVTGLAPNTKYYVRVGVQSSTTAMNFSDQLEFTTSTSR